MYVCMYVCIEIYTLQLYIIDLTQRECHTLRLKGFLEQLCMKTYIWRNSLNMGTGRVQKTDGSLKNYGQVD